MNHHPWHCPRAPVSCQTSQSGFQEIFPSNSITYKIIDGVALQRKNHPKVVFQTTSIQQSALVLFGCLNGDQNSNIVTYVRRIFAHIKFCTLNLSFSISTTVICARHWMLFALKVSNV